MFKKLLQRGLTASILLSMVSGCAGHAARTELARAALDARKPADARALYNKELKVKSAEELPEKAKKETSLLVLDRSMISQALEDYKAASQDMQYADKEVEMLDMSRTPMADVGKYIFSDDSGTYRASPLEKVMINTMNMLNYLARHDLNGARIEARRMSIIQKYLEENKHPAVGANAPGGYIAGFVFERSGRPDIALRYYDEALAHAEFRTLVEPVSRLSGPGSYSTPRLRTFLEKHAPNSGTAEASVAPSTAAPASETAAPAANTKPAADAKPTTSTQAKKGEASGKAPASPAGPAPQTASGSDAKKEAPAGSSPQDAPVAAPESKDTEQLGDLLVVINFGRVPAKVAKRVPIGLALTYASAFMSAASTTQANQLAAQGLVTWVNYPDLEETKRKLTAPQLLIDGKPGFIEAAAALDLATHAAFDKERGKIVASAITRMVTRIIAGQAARAATKDQGWGTVLSLATQATLTAMDTPDTRSWATLPARIAVARVRLAPGKHKLTLVAQGEKRDIEFTMDAGGWHAAVLTVLR